MKLPNSGLKLKYDSLSIDSKKIGLSSGVNFFKRNRNPDKEPISLILINTLLIKDDLLFLNHQNIFKKGFSTFQK
jgi:hypothetical protein